MPNPLISYQQTRFARVLALAQQLPQHADDDRLHELRVELKRVRFIKNVLFGYLEDDRISRAYAPFRKLFKKVGKVRGQYVNLYRLQSVANQRNEAAAQKKLAARKQKLEQRVQQFIRHHMEDLQNGRQAFAAFTLKINTWNDDEFVRTLKKQVKRKINTKTSKKNLHGGRHLLKAVLYSAELSPELAGKISRVFNMARVADLEDAIGDWHDLALLVKGKTVKLVKSKTRRKINAKKQKELKRIRQQIPKLFLP
jgi:CHAD domain-containing protein